jgi:hypothetical protein
VDLIAKLPKFALNSNQSRPKQAQTFNNKTGIQVLNGAFGSAAPRYHPKRKHNLA